MDNNRSNTGKPHAAGTAKEVVNIFVRKESHPNRLRIIKKAPVLNAIEKGSINNVEQSTPW